MQRGTRQSLPTASVMNLKENTMTNEQTAIMLRGISKQLSKAIESAEEYLEGADVARHTDERYIGKTALMFRLTKPRVESDYEKFETTPICLDDIRDVLVEVDLAILQLSANTDILRTDKLPEEAESQINY